MLSIFALFSCFTLSILGVAFFIINFINASLNFMLIPSIVMFVVGVLFLIYYIPKFVYDYKNEDFSEKSNKILPISLVFSLLSVICFVVLHNKFGFSGTFVLFQLGKGTYSVLGLVFAFATIIVSALSALTYAFKIAKRFGAEYGWEEVIFIGIAAGLVGAFATSIYVMVLLLGFNLYMFFKNKFSITILVVSTLTATFALMFCISQSKVLGTNIANFLELLPVLIIGAAFALFHVDYYQNENKTDINISYKINVAILGYVSIGVFVILLVLYNFAKIQIHYNFLKTIFVPIILALIVVALLFFVITSTICLFKKNKNFSQISLSIIACLVCSLFIIPACYNIWLPINKEFSYYAVAGKYDLYHEAYIIKDNVKYTYSDKGLIVTSIVDNTAKEVTISNIDIENDDVVVSDKVYELDLDKQFLVEIEEQKIVTSIYAVAENFLSNNNSVEVLNVKTTLDYIDFYETNAINNCSNLKTINMFAESNSDVCCEYNAFNVSTETKFIVKDPNCIASYVKGFLPILERFELEGCIYADVTLTSRFNMISYDFDDYKPDYANLEFSIYWNVLGVKGARSSNFLNTENMDDSKAVKVVVLEYYKDFFKNYKYSLNQSIKASVNFDAEARRYKGTTNTDLFRVYDSYANSVSKEVVVQDFIDFELTFGNLNSWYMTTFALKGFHY